MIDLHLHLIPAVDDGAASLEEAVELCRIAARDGCTALVATPHRRRDEWPDRPVAELEQRLAEVAAAAEPPGAPRLFLGGEVRVDSELLEGLERPDLGGAIPLAGSRYLLLELEPRGTGPDPVELVSRLIARGWRPIVAHPELTSSLVQDPSCIERMATAGALFQVTAMSVTGDFGRPVRERAAALIESGLAQFVASDAHRPGWRPTGLGRARREIERRWGAERAAALTERHPAAVLENRPLPSLAASA